MPDFPADFVYRGQSLDTLYRRYSLRCHVNEEADKAYYWPKLSQIYDVISPVMAGWADCRLNSDQALQRMIGKVNPDGSFRSSFGNAPVGGLQTLTLDRLKKVSTLYLADNAHLIDRFENEGRMDSRFFTAIHPKCVYFFLHEIMGQKWRIKRDRSVDHRYCPQDLWLQIGGYEHQYAMSRAHSVNQAIDMYLWSGLMPRDECDALARRIGALTGALHIWSADCGYKGESYTDADGYGRVRYSVEDGIEEAVGGCNCYGSRWVDLLG